MGKAVPELPIEEGLVVPLKCAGSLNAASLELPSVLPVLSLQSVASHFLVVPELPLKQLGLTLPELALPIHHPVSKLTFVDSAVSPSEDAFSRLQTFREHALVGVSVWEVLLSPSLRHPLPPLSLVGHV